MMETYLPGDRLCELHEAGPGKGTYLKDDVVFSTRIGRKNFQSNEDEKPIVEVIPFREDTSIAPKISNKVFAKVTRLFYRYLTVMILTVGNTPLPVPSKGQIRIQDIRAKNVDQIIIANCFRPGDIIIARVLFHSDAHGYCLTTRDEDLGVIYAESFSGSEMIKVDKNTMKCPITNVHESRKVGELPK